jgi:hypothetical protein
MATLSPSQATWRRRIESGLRLAAPALDLLLFAGDKLSRIGADREELEPATGTPAVGGDRPRGRSLHEGDGR